MKQLRAWALAIKYTWLIHRKTRHLPPRERQKVILDVQRALHEQRWGTDRG